jgi:hypothetical protein
MQLACRPGVWRYAIEVKPFVKRLARGIVSKLSKPGLEVVSCTLKAQKGPARTSKRIS